MVSNAPISKAEVMISWVDKRFLGLLYAYLIVPRRDRHVHGTGEGFQVATIFLL